LTETEPIVVFTDDRIERRVEIHDETGRLITVIEILSPTNKRELGERQRYLSKRRDFIGAGVNVVEIDLVRQGAPIFPESVAEVLMQKQAAYAVCVFRADQPSQNRVYPIPLRSRLPVIRIPLRPSDSDVLLDLQSLIDQCHEHGRYHRLNYAAPLNPPLRADDEAWAEAILREHGLLPA
jgi:hypothetical protein